MPADNTILQELEALNSQLAAFDNQLPMQVADQNYFNDFPTQILGFVKDECEPVFKGATLPLSTHPNYFDALPSVILDNVKHTHQESHQINAKAPIFLSWQKSRLALAAILIAIISFGGYLTFIGQADHQPLQLLANVENKDIKEYLLRAGDIHFANDKAPQLNDKEIKDRDIVKYLNETGWD